ncbi:MAG: hypothetical protein R8M46_05550 [Ghiorsea sp.]
MEFKKLMTAVALFGALSFGATAVSANTGALTNLKATSGLAVTQGCVACHVGATATTAPNTSRNSFGTAFKATSPKPNYTFTTANWDALKVLNSDSDANGTNLAELTAETNPGIDQSATTTTTTTTTTSSSGGGGGCIASAATTPLMMVLAMLTLGFFVRRKKD